MHKKLVPVSFLVEKGLGGRSTIYEMIRTGSIPSYRIGATGIRVCVAEVSFSHSTPRNISQIKPTAAPRGANSKRGKHGKEQAMRRNITVNVRVQPPEDLIDFTVSDLWRDQYAAQGYTHPSGSYIQSTSTHRVPQDKFVNQNQELDTARQEAKGWKSKAIYMEARCASLEEKIRLLQGRNSRRQAQLTEYKGLPLHAGT